MATATPIIQTIFTVADKASPVFVKINQRMTVINRTAQQTQQRMDAVGRTTKSALTAATFIGAISGAKKLIDITSDYEQQVLRLTGVIEGMGAMRTHEQSLSASVNAYKILNQYAAALPGETEDYVTVFERGLPEALRAGITDMKEIAKFTSEFAAVMMDAKHNADNVGESLNKMLSLHPRMMQRDIVIRMLRIMNMPEYAFRKLNPERRLQVVREALAKMDGMIQAQATSIDAIFGAATSNMKMALIGGIKPLVDTVTTSALAMNEAFTKNDIEIKKTVRNLAMLAIEVGKLAVGMKAISVAMPVVSGLFGLGTRMGGAAASGLIGRMMAPVAARAVMPAAGGMAGATAFLASVVSSLGGFGVVIVAATAIAATFNAILRDTGEIRQKLLGAATALAEAILRLIPELNAGQKTAFASMVESIAEGLTTAFNYIAAKIKANIDDMFGDIPMYFQGEGRMTDYGAYELSLFEQYQRASAATRAKALMPAEPLYYSDIGKIPPFLRRPDVDYSGKDKGTEIKFYNARFDIKQQFAEGFDPDRIAVAFANGIARMGEMKVYSQFTPANSNGL